MNEFIPPQPLDVLQWVTVRLHADGAISTAGTVGDKKMALHLLAQARDAINAQVKDLVIPNRDVDVAPALTTKALGSMKNTERGDP